MGLNNYSQYENNFKNNYEAVLRAFANSNLLNQDTYYNTLKNYGNNQVPPAFAALTTPTNVGKGVTGVQSTGMPNTSSNIAGPKEEATNDASGGEEVVQSNTDTGESTGDANEKSAWEKYLATYGSTGSSDVGGMGYGDYLKTYGTDTEKAYSESVRQANSDYYRTLMTYGKNAEALGGAGLVGAGVSDYGNAVAYAARQGAVATAGTAKMETDAKQAASYAEYLQNLKAQQEAQAKQDAADRTNYMLTLMSTGVDRDTAVAMLNQSGMFTDEAQYNAALGVLNSHYDNVDKKTAEAAQTVTDATQTEANTRYNELTASGMAPDAAEIQVNQEYGEGLGTNARNNSIEITQIHDNSAVNTMVTGNYSPFNENAYTVNYFKKQLAADAISEEEAEAQIEKIENANLDWVYEKLSDANNVYKVDRILEEFGVSGEYESYEAKVKAATDAVNSSVESLVLSGELSEDKAAEYYNNYFAENWELLKKDNEILKYINSIANIRNTVGYMDSGDELYNDILDSVLDDVDFYLGKISDATMHMTVKGNSGKAMLSIDLKTAKKSEVNGVAKIGGFTKDGVAVVLYENGYVEINHQIYKNQGYGTEYKGGNVTFKSVGAEDRFVISDLFANWLRQKCGIR